MLGYNRWQLLKGLAASFCILGIVSFALMYFIPAPPSKVVMASGFKGTSFEHFASRYREIFARSNIELELHETGGAVDNVKLLQDPESGVQIALVTGGISDGEHAPGLLSLGTVYNNPFFFIRRMNRLSGFRSSKENALPSGQSEAALELQPKKSLEKPA
jgi:TRAP-type uncharacterized transport system substrate-binding protein